MWMVERFALPSATLQLGVVGLCSFLVYKELQTQLINRLLESYFIRR